MNILEYLNRNNFLKLLSITLIMVVGQIYSEFNLFCKLG